MFFLLPIGVERATVRIPIITFGIALTCLVALLVTYVLPDDNTQANVVQVLRYWEKRPYLALSDDFKTKVLNAKGNEEVEGLRAEWLAKHSMPDAATIETEQAQLDALMAKVVVGVTDGWFNKLKLSSAGGFQIGWLTHMFLHAGWLHFLGNMLFLYICGPLLEDVWGRRWYFLFYLVGGLVAAGTEFAVSRGQFQGMVGASGAIAACMGAFAVRFAARRVSIFYFLFVFRVIWGIWHWPAWVCGLLWFANQVASFVSHSDPGVAVMAHVGGFAFGGVVAFGMRAIGLEREMVATSEQEVGPVKRSYLRGVEDASQLLQSGDRPGARRALMKALSTAPDDEDAIWMLVRLDFEDGNNKPRATARLEKSIRMMIGKGEVTDAVARLWDLWRFLDVADLSPQFAVLLTKHVREWNADSPMLEELLARAGSTDNHAGNEFLLQAAELASRMQSPSRGKWLLQLESRQQLDEAQKKRLGSITAVPDERRAVGTLPSTAQVIAGVLEGADASGLTMRAAGGATKQVKFSQVVGVAAAVVPAPDNPQHVRLLVDLVLQWAPFVSVRLDSDHAQVQRFFAGKSGREVYGAFIKAVFEGSSGAAGLPSSEALQRGEFPRYENDAAYLEAISTSGL